MPEFEIVELGAMARRALAPGAAGEVRAVFERSFYAVLGGQWVCFGPRALGSGPLNALYERGPADWRGRLTVGKPAHVLPEASEWTDQTCRGAAVCGTALSDPLGPAPTPPLPHKGNVPCEGCQPCEGGGSWAPHPAQAPCLLLPPACGEVGKQASAQRGQRAPRAGWGQPQQKPQTVSNESGMRAGPASLGHVRPDGNWPAPVATGELGHEVRIGNLTFALRAAVEWKPLCSATADPQTLAAGLRALDGILPGLLPQDGLAVLMRPAMRHERLSILARAAEGAVRHLGDLVRVVPTANTLPDLAPLEPLLGLGPGLTPSGDDLIGGAVIALRRLGRADLADAMAAWLGAVADRTNDVSRAHLMAAAEGYGSAALHEVLDGILHGRPQALPAGLAAIDAIGHTSGWDALAGAVVVLRAWLEAQPSGAGRAGLPLLPGL